MIYVLSVIIIILLILLGFLIKLAVDRNEMYLDNINAYDEYFEKIQDKLTYVLSEMRRVDSTGAFESNDEVGFIFNELNLLINTLEEFIDPDFSEKIDE